MPEEYRTQPRTHSPHLSTAHHQAMAATTKPSSRNETVHAQADQHGRQARGAGPPRPEAEQRLASLEGGVLLAQLVVAREVRVDAEADESGCACAGGEEGRRR